MSTACTVRRMGADTEEDDSARMYAELLARDDVGEIDPRELREGHRLIGNRETLPDLYAMAVEGLTGGQRNLAAEVSDGILGQRVELNNVVHGWTTNEGRVGVRCAGFSHQPTGLTIVDIVIDYSLPALIWLAGSEATSPG